MLLKELIYNLFRNFSKIISRGMLLKELIYNLFRNFSKIISRGMLLKEVELIEKKVRSHLFCLAKMYKKGGGFAFDYNRQYEKVVPKKTNPPPLPQLPRIDLVQIGPENLLGIPPGFYDQDVGNVEKLVSSAKIDICGRTRDHFAHYGKIIPTYILGNTSLDKLAELYPEIPDMYSLMHYRADGNSVNINTLLRVPDIYPSMRHPADGNNISVGTLLQIPDGLPLLKKYSYGLWAILNKFHKYNKTIFDYLVRVFCLNFKLELVPIRTWPGFFGNKEYMVAVQNGLPILYEGPATIFLSKLPEVVQVDDRGYANLNGFKMIINMTDRIFGDEEAPELKGIKLFRKGETFEYRYKPKYHTHQAELFDRELALKLSVGSATISDMRGTEIESSKMLHIYSKDLPVVSIYLHEFMPKRIMRAEKFLPDNIIIDNTTKIYPIPEIERFIMGGLLSNSPVMPLYKIGNRIQTEMYAILGAHPSLIKDLLIMDTKLEIKNSEFVYDLRGTGCLLYPKKGLESRLEYKGDVVYPKVVALQILYSQNIYIDLMKQQAI